MEVFIVYIINAGGSEAIGVFDEQKLAKDYIEDLKSNDNSVTYYYQFFQLNRRYR